MDRMLVKSTLAGIVSLSLLAGCGQPSLEQQIQNAEDAYKSENYHEAALTLRNAVQEAPNDANARVLLAQTYYALGDMEGAVSSFERASSMGSDISDYAGEYFSALYSSSDVDQFDTILADLEDNLSATAKAKGQAISALLAARSGNSPKARATLKEALQADDKDIAMLGQIIETYLIKQDTSNKDVLADAAQNFKENWLISSLVAEIAYRMKDYDLSIDTYKRMLDEKPAYLRLNLNIAEAYIQKNEFEEAKPHVNAILKRFNDQPLANQQKALIAVSEEDFAKANSLIERAIGGGLNSPLTSYIAGLTNFRVGNYEQAIQHLAKIINDVPATHPAKQMYVAAKLQVGASRDAFNVLASNPELVKQNETLAAATSVKLLGNGDRRQASSLLRDIDESKIDDDRTRQQLGVLKVLSGDTSGMQLIETASNAIVSEAGSGDTSQSKLLLLSLKTSSGEIDEARSLLKQWINDEPDNVQNYLISAELEKYVENYDALPGIYDKVLKLDPENKAALNNKALRAYNLKDFDMALSLFNKVLELAPNNKNAILGAFRSIQAKGNNPQQLIDSLSKRENTTAFSRLYANYLAAQYTQVVEIGEKSAFNDIDTPMAVYLMGDAYLKTNQPQKAVDLLRKLVIQDRTNDTMMITLAKAQAMTNRPNDALKTLQSISQNDPAIKDEGAFIKARIQLSKNAAAKAQSALDEASEQAKGSAEGLMLAGRTNLALGNASAAVTQLASSYEKNANGVTAQYYYQALKETDQQEEAISMLKKYVDSTGGNANAQMMLASELAKDRPQEAIDYYQQILQKQPENWVAMNNMAWLMSEQNQLDEAHQWIRKALKIKPANQTLLSTKSQIEAKM